MNSFKHRALCVGLVPLAASLSFAGPQLRQGTQSDVAIVPAPGEPSTVQALDEPEFHLGERVPDWAVESMGVGGWDEVFEREAKVADPEAGRRMRRGAQGTWVVPGLSRSGRAHSGTHLVSNKWGDTSMGIRFDEVVDLSGVWIAGMGPEGSWSPAVRAIGYLEGAEVQRTEWHEAIGDTMAFFALPLSGVDRVVFESRVAVNGSGFFALDDLAFVGADGVEKLVHFEDVEHDTKLTGTRFAGLIWEEGTGDFDQPAFAPPGAGSANRAPSGLGAAGAQATTTTTTSFLGGGGTAPTLLQDFNGPRFGNAGAFSIPPDTVGAVGPDHFVASVNSNISIYEKATGVRLVNTGLAGFLNSSGVGDPRVVFDPDSQRWIILASDFDNQLFFAVSTTSDPTGSFFRFNFITDLGADAGTFPDYPTLGVDERGIYTGVFPAGSGPARMTIFAIDKAPLVAANPSLGTVTAFRNLTFEGAIQPAVHYEDDGGAYCISVNGVNRLRVRRVNPPLTNPTLQNVGFVTVQNHNSPPDAPSMGSTTPLDTVGDRLMNAVYINGSIWTTHCVASMTRSGARWYEVDPGDLSAAVQFGTINDPVMYFLFPTIAVNEAGDVVIGFSATSPSMFAGAWVTGRRASDPPGEMGVPFEYRAGLGPYNNLDGFGRNRWGDYSLTSLDPVDGTFWTIQERARNNNTWATTIAQLNFDGGGASNYCVSTPNSFSISGATISNNGSVGLGANDLELVATGAATNQFGLFFYGDTQVQTSLGNGFLCVGGNIVRFPAGLTDAGGMATFLVDNQNLPAGTPALVAGETQNFQFWFRDAPGGGSGFNFSNGLSVTFQP